MLRFLLVGVVNTIVGTAIMFILYNVCGQSYWVSSAANYILTSILSYFLNKRFTFRSKGRSVSEALRFFLSIAVCYLLAYGIAKPAVRMLLSGKSEALRDNAAMLAGMCLFTVFNYIGQRFFAFRRRRQDPAR